MKTFRVCFGDRASAAGFAGGLPHRPTMPVADFSPTSNRTEPGPTGYLTAPETSLILYTATENQNCHYGDELLGV